MHLRQLFLVAAVGALALAHPSRVSADEPRPKAGARLIVFGEGEGVARFEVRHDRAAGTLTFRLADSSAPVVKAPVVSLESDAGPREVRLVALAGQPGAWVMTDDALRNERYRGTMRIVVSDQEYTASIVPSEATVRRGARHGGTWIEFPDCGGAVEVVQDPAAGTLTIYSTEDVQVLEAPVVTLTETERPATVTVTPVEGQKGAWRVVHRAFKTTTYSGSIRLLVGGKPCEAVLVPAPPHGGRIFTVSGGPRFEVVRDEKGGAYTFYALDETLNGKAYAVEGPRVVYTTHEGPRTVTLVPVEGEPRAWRLIGLEGGLHEPGDARLQFTLFGKSLETRVGLSGIGIDLK